MEENDAWGAPSTSKVKNLTEAVQEAGITAEDSRGAKVSKMISLLIESMDEVYQNTFDTLGAERIAALALKCRMELAEFIKDSELRFRQSKNDLKLVRAEAKYKYHKQALEEDKKKPADATLEMLVDKDEEVRDGENRVAELEVEAKKWQNLLGIVQDAHIFFRNLNKQ